MLIPSRVFQIHRICDRDASRYALGAVKFTRDARTGEPYAVACDGRRLAILSWPEDSAADYPAGNACPVDNPAPAAEFETLLSAADCQQAARWKGSRVKPILNNVAIDEHSANGRVTIGATNIELVERRDVQSVDGKFPNWRDVIPARQQHGQSFTVDLRLLADLLDVAKSQGADEVTFTLTNRDMPHGEPIIVTAKPEAGERGASMAAVIMPIRESENGKTLPHSGPAWLPPFMGDTAAEPTAQPIEAPVADQEPPRRPAAEPSTTPPAPAKPRKSRTRKPARLRLRHFSRMMADAPAGDWPRVELDRRTLAAIR